MLLHMYVTVMVAGPATHIVQHYVTQYPLGVDHRMPVSFSSVASTCQAAATLVGFRVCRVNAVCVHHAWRIMTSTSNNF